MKDAHRDSFSPALSVPLSHMTWCGANIAYEGEGSRPRAHVCLTLLAHTRTQAGQRSSGGGTRMCGVSRRGAVASTSTVWACVRMRNVLAECRGMPPVSCSYH